jgi:nitrate/nitrite-specific signal transduction histidine kinase
MAESGGGDDLLTRQREFFTTFFRRGAEVADELLREHERLSSEVQALGKRYEERLAEIERENQNLASLYVAAYQLHVSLDRADVMRTIGEILLNFVGARTFAIYVVEPAGARLRAVAGEGADPVALPPVDLPAGEGDRLTPPGPAGAAPLAAVPLRLRGEIVGAVAIWELLAQKPALDSFDHELLNLLGSQAAVALEAARLQAGAATLA